MASSSTPGTPDINDPIHPQTVLAELKHRAKWCANVCKDAEASLDKVGGQLFQLELNRPLTPELEKERVMLADTQSLAGRLVICSLELLPLLYEKIEEIESSIKGK
jgi:hypothetical protein